MTPEKMQEIVEDYPNLMVKREKLQNRLIKCSGRNKEQEMTITKRLESVEKLIELILEAIYGDIVLTGREETAVNLRMDGLKLREIAEMYFLSTERIRQILKNAYMKMANAINKQNIA